MSGKPKPMRMLYTASNPTTGGVRSQSTTTRNENPSCTRDRDLLSTDHCLTDDALDDLWDWFCAAHTNGVDMQLVFVKMVNSARKPYVDYLISKHHEPTSKPQKAPGPITCAVAGDGDDDDIGVAAAGNSDEDDIGVDPNINLGHTRKSSTTTDCYTPKQSTVTENKGSSSHRQQNDNTGTDTLVRIMKQLEIEHGLLKDKFRSLTETKESSPPPPEALVPPPSIRVVITLNYWPRMYMSKVLTMNGSGVTSSVGGGDVKLNDYVHGDGAVFELVRHPELGPGAVSFKSTSFNNLFIHAGGPGARVNCAYGCTPLTKFRLVSEGLQAVVIIESIAFPGQYFRTDDACTIRLGLALNDPDEFLIVLVP